MRTANFSCNQLDAATHMHAVCVREDQGSPLLWKVTLFVALHESLFEVGTRTVDDSEYLSLRAHLSDKALPQEGRASKIVGALGYLLILAMFVVPFFVW